MSKRSELLKNLLVSAEEKLKKFADPQNKEYINLLKQLILQGMVKLLEPIVKIRVRLQDRDNVAKLFPECEKEYTQIMLKETEREYICKLELEKKDLEIDW